MARVDFGLSDDEFGRLTPGEFTLFRERIEIRERHADARIAALIKVMGVKDMSVEDIIDAISAVPDKPYVPTAEEIAMRERREREEFDKALNA